MSACDDFLFFDLPEDWEQIAQVIKQSEVIGNKSNKPIDAFDLGVNLDNSYVAVLIQTTQSKSSWRFGGELRQVWNFPKGQQTNSNFGKIKSSRQVLPINNLQIIKLVKPTSDTFDLRYYPPPWFKDVIVIAWRYIGEVENFVKDTLFDIGNQLGINDSGQSSNNILTEIQAQSELIRNSVADLNASVAALQDFQTQDFTAIIEAVNALNTDSNLLQQLNQLDAGIFTLFEALKNLIPQDQADQLEGSLRTRLDLQDEFL